MMTLDAQPLRVPTGRVLCQLPALTLRPGQCWVVLGPNGAGKSTFLQALAGTASGAGAMSVRWQAQALPAWHDPGLARQRAVLTQRGDLPAGVPVRRVLALAAHPWGGWPADQQDLRDAVVATWSLEPLWQRAGDQLSGGERQRVRLALADLHWRLAQRTSAPTYGLLDEPLTALDAPHQRLALAFVQRQVQAGALAVLTLHDVNAALAVASHVLVLGRGEVLLAGALVPETYRAALEQAFDTRLCWVSHPESGRPWLLPAAPWAAADPSRVPLTAR